jgi:DNA sulfur modification protein DndD
MILLKSAKFVNFRGLRNVDLVFSTDPKKKLTVIRASNGTGKTTVMSALTWGLFGDEALTGGRRKRNSERLSPSDWSLEVDGSDVEISVEIEIQVIDTETNTPTNFHIIRKQTEHFTNSSSFSAGDSELTVLKETPKGSSVQPQPELFLARSFLPLPLKDIFFFDGDSALKFTDRDDASGRRQGVNDAIRKLLGLEILEQADKHLELAKAAILKKVRDDNPGTPIEALISRELKLNEEIQKLDEDLVQIRGDHGSLHDEKTKQESTRDEILASGGGRKEELRKQFETAGKQLKAAEEDLERNIRALREKLNTPELLFQISKGFLKTAETIFDDLEEKKVIPNTLPEILETTLANGICICGADIGEGTKGHKHIDDTLKGLKDQTASNGILLNLSQSLKAAVRQSRPGALNWVTGVQENQRTTSDLRSRGDELRLQLEALQEQLRQIPDANLGLVLNRISELERSLKDKWASQKVIENSVDVKQRELAEIGREKSLLESRNQKYLMGVASQHAAEDLIQVVKKTIAHLKNETVDEVSQKMNDLFLQMIANTDGTGAIAGVKLSREFDISVIGPGEESYSPTTYLNGASRRALTVAFILALVQVSGESAMTVIDTPLGMADGAVRRALLKTLINESVQPILFLTYSEIKEVEDILDEAVGCSQTMTNSQHYPDQLVNKPKTGFSEVLVCQCNHRQSCKICKRKVEAK